MLIGAVIVAADFQMYPYVGSSLGVSRRGITHVRLHLVPANMGLHVEDGYLAGRVKVDGMGEARSMGIDA